LLTKPRSNAAGQGAEVVARSTDNWALALKSYQDGEPSRAAEYCQLVLKRTPRSPDALQLLSGLRFLEGRLEEALVSARRAVAFAPRVPANHNNMAAILVALGQPQEALTSCDKALVLKPDYPEALNNRGNALSALQQHDEAILAYDQALAFRPNYPEALNNRAKVLLRLRRIDDAIASCDQALIIAPTYADAYNTRGCAFDLLGRFEEALRCYKQVLDIKPDHVEALNNRGKALATLGQMDEAIAAFRKALAFKPDFREAHSNLIFWLDFMPTLGFAEHYAERRKWVEIHGTPHAKAFRRHTNVRDPERRLVIGYVSADFRKHSASSCFGPILRRHDHKRFEVVCYSMSGVEDDVTRELRSHADRWHAASGMSDDKLAEQVRADGIDILVDLSGHSAGNRLAVFARKPAPVQITAWGNATGTGLPAIDYLFSDPVAVPLKARHHFAETIYDLPCITTVEMPPDLPPIAVRPGTRPGVVTFGSLNRLAKISPAAFALWGRILRALPNTRLLLKDTALNEEPVRARVLKTLAAEGIAADRIELRGGTPHAEHLAACHNIDIALDPFPHSGGVTTYETLWMGVPVIALTGISVASRVSAGILSALGLSDWVTDNEEDYLALAIERANDVSALAALRRGLRAKITASAAGDVVRYTHAVESAYRTMWRTYCAEQTRY
jgi:predicted O-linked N-acetylglucosamine transferase (SPINDLY family)